MHRVVLGFRQFSKVSKEALIEQIRAEIASNHTVIYSKTYCPYCERAKEKLSDLKLEPLIKELDEDPLGPHIQNALQEMTKQRTVPNIFINGVHIGGCDDLLRKSGDGSISRLLSESGSKL
jgi:glutaredoxin 3